MKEKFPILFSPRFQGVVAIGILEALILFKVIDGFQFEGLSRIIEAVIGTAVSIKTVDRTVDTVAGKV